MQTVYTSPIGLSVSKGDWEDAQWTITGNLKEAFHVRSFESAYDFQDWVEKNIQCSSIEFDSEYCQFFAYAKSKQRATSFVKAIEKRLEKLKKLIG
jgi:hypothetical protein